MFLQQYAGRRVFVTGHTGFKGFWLTAWLRELGAEVGGWSLGLPTQPSGFAALGLEGRIAHIQGDVRDRSGLAGAIRRFKPDIVFHLAAQALVRRSYDDPAGTFESNAVGTMNMLEALRETPEVKAAVFITSDKCYRNNEWVFGYRETDRLGGDDPYSASKACAEMIFHAYCRSFFLSPEAPRLATARAGNVIGGGDFSENRIVPDCARAYAAGKEACLRNPLATRPWQHVLEPLSGYLWLGARLLLEKQGRQSGESASLHGEAFNFGPSGDVNATVLDVARALAVHWPGFSIKTAAGAGDGKRESTLLKLCCDKALARLQWEAALSFQDCVRFTAEWYRRYYALDADGSLASEAPGMYDFTLSQIADYCRKAEERSLAWSR
ncbi:MAG: CDP-glucose 4,6-dehydratase [Desulfovibrio sp.]|jgi:CDP-glucose 4,6-dehydratase|nr:CDP-glucose 4,6-dehydratase [Desulfovibrio sp.]